MPLMEAILSSVLHICVLLFLMIELILVEIELYLSWSEFFSSVCGLLDVFSEAFEES